MTTEKPKFPSHINGAEVSSALPEEIEEDKTYDVACKDGKSYTWNSKTGEVFPRKP